MELNELQKARIRAGAMLLDEKAPGWYNKIDMGKLDVDSFSCCVVCQTFGWGFNDGLEQLGLARADCLASASEAADFGFYPHMDEAAISLELTPEEADAQAERTWLKNEFWKTQINMRRGADYSER